MIFPKGPRFEPPNMPNVPGPNTSNLAQDSQLDSFKRGAFLEKTGRFFKEKTSDTPGPGTNFIDGKDGNPVTTGNKRKQNHPDRYALLQRKVDELEKLHADGKKFHQDEVGRLRLDLARSKKENRDQKERLEKQAKQHEWLDNRVQELKKAASVDQAEIKDLRIKLQKPEHDRAQPSREQVEVGDCERALSILELKWRDEMRARNQRITELEMTFAVEKNREVAEARLQGVIGSGDEEVQVLHNFAQTLQEQVNEAQDEVRRTRSSLEALQEEKASREEGLVLQLEQYRMAMDKVAEEYGRLASTTVAKSAYSRIKHEHATLQMRLLRLERKLTNSEGQVLELAQLIRHSKEENIFLARRLHDEEESLLYSTFLREANDNAECGLQSPHHSLLQDVATVGQELLDSAKQIRNICTRDKELSSQFYGLIRNELMVVYSSMERELMDEKGVAQMYAAELLDAAAERDSLLGRLGLVCTEQERLQHQFGLTTRFVEELTKTSETLKCQLAVMDGKMQEQAWASKVSLKGEQETVQRLTNAVQKSRMVEDELRAEINLLAIELTDVGHYQEAYCNLHDEVRLLLARNSLAEEEAQRLSTLNAEVLGHNNPAQRIMYVDRIRKELAEVKHNLITTTRDHEAAIADNADLRHELGMYKSVVVPVENKPRTNITRIDRPPR